MSRIPFKHQGTGRDFLKKRKGAILADEMGLGKTYQTIMALGQISQVTNVIVCPASLKTNWEREIHQEYPEDVVCVAGTNDEDFPDAAWLVVNYDRLSKWKEIILASPFSLVGDEAHYIKGKSKRTDDFLELAKAAERVYLLTGTPIMNRPMELFNLLKAIGHPLGKGKTAFAERYCAGAMKALVFDKSNGRRMYMPIERSWTFRENPGRYRVQPIMEAKGASNLEELQREISGVFLRRKKTDVLDLPEKLIQTIPVELSPEWQKRYDSAFDDYIDFLRENPVTGKDVDAVLLARHIVELQKLKQVCSQGKLERIKEDVDELLEAEEKVVLFTQYQKTLEDLRGMWKGAVSLAGEDTMKVRDKAIDSFQNGKAPVFVGNIKAAGVGITLTAASNVLFADLDWTPAIHDQAMDRCHRIGQAGTVNVRYYVAAGTVEEDILEMHAAKRATAEAVLEGGEAAADQGVMDLIGRLSTHSR